MNPTSAVAAATVRMATSGDAGAILTIYNHFVTNTTATFDLEPRTFSEQLAWLESRSGAFPATVLVVDGIVAGFGSLSEFRPRLAYRTTVENSVYVAPDAQGHGYGRLLLEDLIDRARAHGFHTMIARITGNNDASVALHERCGFTTVGTERQVGRKFGHWLDVIVMQLML